ncbi:MAG: hypothetical protein ACI4QZ_08265, partial [Eubacteriales bacterium]
NRNFPSILPKNVLEHFGHVTRPSGVFNNDIKYSLSKSDEAEAEKDVVDINGKGIYNERETNSETGGNENGKVLHNRGRIRNQEEIPQRTLQQNAAKYGRDEGFGTESRLVGGRSKQISGKDSKGNRLTNEKEEIKGKRNKVFHYLLTFWRF